MGQTSGEVFPAGRAPPHPGAGVACDDTRLPHAGLVGVVVCGAVGEPSVNSHGGRASSVVAALAWPWGVDAWLGGLEA